MLLCCVLIAVSCATLVIFKFLKKSEKDVEWQLIGEVKNIFIYPIDGGIALNVRRALCTKSGLRYNRLVDRSIITYSLKNYSAVLYLNDICNWENRVNLGTDIMNAVINFNEQRESSTKSPDYFEINYLNDPVKVLDFPKTEALATQLGTSANQIEFCYLPARKRSQFMKKIRNRFAEIIDITVKGYSSLYSNYTIVDDDSFQELRRKVDPYSDIPLSFNPQLVVDGKIPKNTTAIRIGNEKSKIKFKNLNPCNIILPTFQAKSYLVGFNMELNNQTVNSGETVMNGGMIRLGDKVYVQTL